MFRSHIYLKSVPFELHLGLLLWLAMFIFIINVVLIKMITLFLQQGQSKETFNYLRGLGNVIYFYKSQNGTKMSPARSCRELHLEHPDYPSGKGQLYAVFPFSIPQTLYKAPLSITPSPLQQAPFDLQVLISSPSRLVIILRRPRSSGIIPYIRPFLSFKF